MGDFGDSVWRIFKKGLAAGFSSKTFTIWIIIALLATIILFTSWIYTALVGTAPPFLLEIYAILGISGGGDTLRNVTSDGVMPRLAQIEGAKKDPSVSVQAPVSMAHSSRPGDDDWETPYTPSPPIKDTEHREPFRPEHGAGMAQPASGGYEPASRSDHRY